MENKLNCVLLIDDDEATNLVNKMVVNKLDCAESVEIAYNGQEALDFLKSTTDGKYPQPDLIILDINMPVMDGWEFLEEYNQLNDDQLGRVVVTMLTTSLNPEDKAKADNSPNINDFLNKPLTTEALAGIIAHYFPEKADAML